jgi:hypothetical protein
MTVRLPGVLVPGELVGSSGFRAHVGARVPMALEAYCRFRVPASEQDRRGPAAGPSPGADLLLTGVSVPFVRVCRLGGWMLEIAGIPLHVTEASATPGLTVITGVNDRETGSDPAEPFPAPHTWVRARATVSVAADHVVGEVEPALGRKVERPWLVERIVRLAPAGRGSGQQVESIRHTAEVSSYLLDLVTPPA